MIKMVIIHKILKLKIAHLFNLFKIMSLNNNIYINSSYKIIAK